MSSQIKAIQSSYTRDLSFDKEDPFNNTSEHRQTKIRPLHGVR